jgi:hypothetical protein
MPLDLDSLEQRIVGVLIEKELTVPESYPLTLNALVAGCSQKSNRDPVMAPEDYEIEGALRSLMDKAWVTRREVGGRTMRYAHEVGEQLGVGEAGLALLGELLCRGPQAPGYLKTRASRMHPFDTPEAVEAELRALADRPVPYVEKLPRQPRERAARWRHRLGKNAPGPSQAEAVAAQADAAPRPTPAAAPAPPGAPTDFETRLAALEAEVRALSDRLDRAEERDAPVPPDGAGPG